MINKILAILILSMLSVMFLSSCKISFSDESYYTERRALILKDNLSILVPFDSLYYPAKFTSDSKYLIFYDYCLKKMDLSGNTIIVANRRAELPFLNHDLSEKIIYNSNLIRKSDLFETNLIDLTQDNTRFYNIPYYTDDYQWIITTSVKNNNFGLHIINPDSLTMINLYKDTPFVSPVFDSDHFIYYFSKEDKAFNYNLYKYDLISKTTNLMDNNITRNPISLISADGKYLVYTKSDTQIACLNTQTAAVDLIYQNSSININKIQLSSDSTELYFLNNRKLININLLTKQVTKIFISKSFSYFHLSPDNSTMYLIELYQKKM